MRYRGQLRMPIVFSTTSIDHEILLDIDYMYHKGVPQTSTSPEEYSSIDIIYVMLWGADVAQFIEADEPDLYEEIIEACFEDYEEGNNEQAG